MSTCFRYLGLETASRPILSPEGCVYGAVLPGAKDLSQSRSSLAHHTGSWMPSLGPVHGSDGHPVELSVLQAAPCGTRALGRASVALCI